VAAPAHEHGHQLGDHLYIHRHTWIHDLPAQNKVIALIAFMVLAVNIPIERWDLLATLLVLVFGLWFAAKLPIKKVAPRLLIEIPFVFFAILLPFIATGERVEILGVSVSQPGLTFAIAFLLKSTIGVAIAILLSATSTAQEILTGLNRLRMPGVLLQIAALMVRYSAVVTSELQRMEISRQARNGGAGLSSWPSRASSVGALFIRSYERGERVHLAMLSRGGDGGVVLPAGVAATRLQWFVSLMLPAAALAFVIWSRV
jgi:cobalt/nickel transport system permease protein